MGHHSQARGRCSPGARFFVVNGAASKHAESYSDGEAEEYEWCAGCAEEDAAAEAMDATEDPVDHENADESEEGVDGGDGEGGATQEHGDKSIGYSVRVDATVLIGREEQDAKRAARSWPDVGVVEDRRELSGPLAVPLVAVGFG